MVCEILRNSGNREWDTRLLPALFANIVRKKDR